MDVEHTAGSTHTLTEGLLDEVPYRRLVRVVATVRTEDAARMLGLLKD